MNMTRDEAVAALRDVETAEVRAKISRAYRIGSPHLILWGVIWVVGYTLTGLLPPRQYGAMWITLTVAGIVGSTIIGRAARATAGAGPKGAGRYWFVTFAGIWLFVAATYAVMRPTSNLQYEVFPALVVSLVYAIIGAWGQTRYLWIGTAVFVLSLIGYFFLKPYLPFWLAIVGGGGLVAGGLWLRRA